MTARLNEEELKQAVADYVKKHVGMPSKQTEVKIDRVTFEGLQGRKGRGMITAVTASASSTEEKPSDPKPR